MRQIRGAGFQPAWVCGRLEACPTGLSGSPKRHHLNKYDMTETAAPLPVLVIEDDPDTRANLRDVLELDDYHVVTVGTAAEALRYPDLSRLTAIILDRRLPDGTAEDLLPRLRQLAPQAAVIIATGYADVQGAITALRLGAADYILKPINADELRARLGHLAERVRAEEQIRTLTTIPAESPTPVLRVAADGTILYANNASAPLLSLWGCGPGQRLAEDSWAPLRDTLNAGTNHEVEVTCGTRVFSLLVAPTKEARYLNVYGRDVTERRTAEWALQETNRRLEHALDELRVRNEEIHAMTQQLWQAAKLASVGELAASIAHELNNPLATVRLRIESVLAQTSEEDRRHRPLSIISQEAKRMGDLVANLLQFSRRGADVLTTVEIREELLKTRELVQHHLRKRAITVVDKFAPDTPTIYADRQKLRQVFLNLLTNACDAMPQGGTLTLHSGPDTTAQGEPAGRIEFSDTGVGIAPEHLEKVLEPFFTTKEEGQGTGLGLAICRRVVQEHYGTLQIFSEVGKGTTVRIVLPVSHTTNVDRLRGPA
jgi:signal transduction histidine kinase/ActR/RegA family two-component response regulator